MFRTNSTFSSLFTLILAGVPIAALLVSAASSTITA